ncbi:beta-lactamase family protein [Aliifodinibius sp. S!AR15-10]|uniref:serine hydrolase domain-containing protein n=1 Tax=Aliifodinibius sp. S!AR15-10 TaxID=2950437 RepID=UPI0028571232|nr:serine hydrolase domain-containing protein [Aliifodinibius sp. S!AR15-10]MDR8392470.1 beta-lactamase family protein [Aliifodinibius sp. S!AR15-10]
MRRTLVLLIVLTLFVCLQLPAQPTDFGKVDSLVGSYADQELFSGAVLVARDGEVYSNGYGMANRSWSISNSADTRFQVASLTKSFTAILVLQLVDQGSISLNDPLSMYLPDYPAQYAADVTVRHLLSHTSGIPSYTNFESWPDTTSRVDVRPANFVNVIAQRELLFPPGTDFSYSNSNYFLLGIIIEKITGMSYGRVLQDRILEPAQMENTGYQFNRMVVERMAEGYERLSNGFYEKAPFQSPSTAYAAGGIYSVVNDLYRWVQLLYADKLLPEDIRNEMMTPGDGNYGYGWVVGGAYPDEVTDFFKAPFTFSSNPQPNEQSYRLVWHWGSNPGFNSLLVRVPGPQWTIIILENQHLMGDPEGTKIYDIAGEIFELLARQSAS